MVVTGALSGKRVLITRPRRQAEDLARQLAELGAQPVYFPTIEIAPMQDPTPLDEALAHLDAYDWVVFTSANGVEAVWDRLAAVNMPASTWEKVNVAAIGPVTAKALEAHGVKVSFMPDQYVEEAFAEGFTERLGKLQNLRFLLLRAEIARQTLVDELERRGAAVTNIAVYRTVDADPDPEVWAELERGDIDIVTLTSASTARRFGQAAAVKAWPWLAGCIIACIGPITADAARECGLHVQVTAEEFTTAGLLKAVVAYRSNQMETTMKDRNEPTA